MTKVSKLAKRAPRFLLCFKRDVRLNPSEPPAKDDFWIEARTLIASCLFLIVIVVLMINAFRHHTR
jgi:hypothetical protein